MKINSLYICVKDMDRAINFYKDFFEVDPIIKDVVYSVFDVSGFRFGLFNYQEMNEEHSYGSNCLPSIEVDNLYMLKEKTKNLEICFPLTIINGNYVTEFIDSEGNHIELTTKVK